jgi:aldehyde:ferredoxin oxidoreductase
LADKGIKSKIYLNQKKEEIAMMIRNLNLNTGSFQAKHLDPILLSDYLGGIGLAVRLMADYNCLKLPALDPSLPLIITIGSLNATGFPGANKTCFFGVSPLTGIFAGSWLGGDFSNGLVRSGTSALVLEGKAKTPSIIVVHEDSIELIPRNDLWKKSVSETQNILNEKYKNQKMVVIGPAGERLVFFACVMGNEGHAAGRCGFGAILGSKNIKAIVAGGNAKPFINNPEQLKIVNRKAMKAIRESDFLNDIQGPIGTPFLTKIVNEFETLPTANFQERYFKRASNLYGERIANEFVCKRSTCPYCPVRCRFHVRIDGKEMKAPEYETICMFGSNNRIDDYSLIVKANALCNDLGLDTISAGNVIAFYREYSNSMEDHSNVLDLIRSIAYKEDEGVVLAKGCRSAATKFNVDYAMHVKGLELPGYDPRKLIGMAISYSTANRGGCHSRAWTVADEIDRPGLSAEQLAELVVAYHNHGYVKDSLITCTFLDGDIRPFYAEALSAVLGTSFDDDQLILNGERIYTLERLMNIQRGVTAKSDVLPKRLIEGLVDLDKYTEGMRIYYQLRDWNSNGIPISKKIKSLKLGFIQ